MSQVTPETIFVISKIRTELRKMSFSDGGAVKEPSL